MLASTHNNFLKQLIHKIEKDDRFEAVLAGGSIVHGGFDEYSDLDLVLLVKDEVYSTVLTDRRSIASQWGNLLAAFTGEHVGEPRLLICLYDPIIHVDLKFVRRSDFIQAVERPLILWSRDHDAITRIVQAVQVFWPNQSSQWFEDRAWIWLHYAGTKLQRGELFEAMGMLAFFREQVLGPMLHRRSKRLQRGVRRIESDTFATEKLLAVSPHHDSRSISRALGNAVEFYMILREDDRPECVVNGMPDRLLPFLSAPLS